jgi:CubicO group peptidase (beta-lactamase class C family)
VRKPSDLLRPALGWGVPAGQPIPTLAEYYQDGLHVDTEPGTKWAYSNNGFATLGQIVKDVSGLPLDRYLREHVFGPLGMNSSDLVRSERVRPRLATGYEIRSRGATAVRDLEMVQAGGGAVYSTTGDMARYVAALLGGGANSCSAALRPQTLAEMFEPQYQPDPRIPGMGLGFFRGQAGGYRTIGHDGIWLGFHSAVALVPDEARLRVGHVSDRVQPRFSGPSDRDAPWHAANVLPQASPPGAAARTSATSNRIGRVTLADRYPKPASHGHRTHRVRARTQHQPAGLNKSAARRHKESIMPRSAGQC